MGYDNKYGQVVLENGDIPDDEPVIVFRARDKLTPQILQAYHTLCRASGSPERHLELIQDTFKKFKKWQEENLDKIKTPDSESSRAWRD